MFSAACGVWQKTQICDSLVAFTVPGPEAERLCFVLEMSATWRRVRGRQRQQRQPARQQGKAGSEARVINFRQGTGRPPRGR